jgi:transposase
MGISPPAVVATAPPFSTLAVTPPQIERFVALDISKLTVVVAAADAKQQIILQPKKVPVTKFENWARCNLRMTDAVVLEATGSAWYYYDLLQPLVGSVIVANPQMVKLIAQTKVKTDARDAVALARLLAAGMIPQVWVPPQEVRELRSLVAQRQRLITQRTQARNRLHSILFAHNLVPPLGDPFDDNHQDWWKALTLSATEKLLIAQEFVNLNHLQPLVHQVETELFRLSTAPYWSASTTFLVQLPGIAVLTAMTILSAIGDIKRFETAKKLVGYSGLGVSIYSSGQVSRTGSITKQGRHELRTALVEAAWNAVEREGHWKDLFERLKSRLGSGKAIIVIARKLLVVVWNVLTKKEADHQADEERVARKILNWAYKIKRSGRGGLRGRDFLKQELQRLKIGSDLSTITYNGKPYSIASPPPKPKEGEAVEEAMGAATG